MAGMVPHRPHSAPGAPSVHCQRRQAVDQLRARAPRLSAPKGDTRELVLPGGPLLMTFTPLLGMSEVVRRFILETSPQRTIIKMTQDDAEHYTEEQRANIIAQYPEHMRDIRARGIPQFGAGLVFPIDKKSLMVEPFERPKNWIRLGGLDFG